MKLDLMILKLDIKEADELFVLELVKVNIDDECELIGLDFLIKYNFAIENPQIGVAVEFIVEEYFFLKVQNCLVHFHFAPDLDVAWIEIRPQGFPQDFTR